MTQKRKAPAGKRKARGLTVRERDVVAAVMSWARSNFEAFDTHAPLRLMNAVQRLKDARRGGR